MQIVGRAPGGAGEFGMCCGCVATKAIEETEEGQALVVDYRDRLWNLVEKIPMMNPSPAITTPLVVELQMRGIKGENPDGTKYWNPDAPGEYRFRRPGEEWPKHWMKTLSLAGAVIAMGWDVIWERIPMKSIGYLLGTSDAPRLPFYLKAFGDSADDPGLTWHDHETGRDWQVRPPAKAAATEPKVVDVSSLF